MPPSARNSAKPRPVYLNLVQIRLPLPGMVSILHRISGALLFVLGIPVLLYALERSLASPESFAALQMSMAHPLAKLVLIALVWAYLHHFCAGIRYLLIDAHVGDDLRPARQSSIIVLVASLALTLIVAVRLW
ncbi:MAG: succinate dehydrogenase, cytochrome b556 subunit [Betaproteobacteria bacterium]|nr:MAG: succinate dehydrogenase, cytochrome b556 subunit [Betaproteobacteria bacterium]